MDYCLIISIILSFSFVPLAAQVPNNPNTSDAQGKRQGKWTIRFDKNWKAVTNPDSVLYYRTIEYKDDKPSGVVRDYYISGKVQWVGFLESDRPNDVFDYSRPFNFFKEDGTDDTQWHDLNRQGQELYDADKLTDASPIWEKALEKATVSFGKEHENYLIALHNLTVLYNELRSYAKAEPLFIELLQTTAKVLGKENQDYAKALMNLGSLYIETGRYAKAEPLYVEAKEIRGRVLGKDDPAYATSLNNLALVYNNMGFYSKAEPLYVESLEIKARVLGKENGNYATTLSNMASQYHDLGNYSKAEALYLEAMEIRERVLGKDHNDYASSLNALGLLYKNMGNYTKAEAFYLEAKEIKGRILGDHPDYANTLGNLGALYYELKIYDKAENFYLVEKQVLEKTVGKTHPSYANSINGLAGLYNKLKMFSKAEPYFLEALQLRAQVLGKQHPDYAVSLNNLASHYQDMKEYAKAEPLYLESLDIAAQRYGKNHPDYIATLNNFGLLYRDMGKYLQALEVFRKVIDAKQMELKNNFSFLSEKEKQLYYRENVYYFSSFERFCIEHYEKYPELLGDLYNLKLSTKGILFSATNKVRQRILRSNDAALIDQYNRWQSKKDFLAKVYKMPATTQKDIGVDEKQLEAEVNTIEKELSVKSEIFGRLTDQKFNTWMNIRQSLKAGEAAIEMISTRINSDKEDIYALLIVTQQSQINPDIVILNNRYELEGKLSRYYLNSIKQKVKDEISYNHYWKPVAEKLKGIRKVYFAAEGVYHQINLNTLYNPATGKYLLDEIEVQLVQSTKDIVNRKVISQKIKDVTLFGYPDYNNMRTLEDVKGKSTNEPAASNGAEIIGDTTQRFFNGENILELPGTKIEVETIESLLRQKNIQIHRYVSDSATEGAIKKLNNPAVLHVATHGFFLADINYFGTDTLAGMSSRKLYDNPLLRSGLLFAGVKAAFSATADTQDDSQEDGMLTAYEAMNLHLDQTNLVVLSACETGLGEISNGEGVYGLQRAFQVAGAKSVLMSLWTVSDEATQKLMSLFYENWLNGKPPREAFRVAQLSLRGKYPEPFYWGAFVLVGE